MHEVNTRQAVNLKLLPEAQKFFKILETTLKL
jgi:hypothetical protein